MGSTKPPRTPEERLAYLRGEYRTVMHIIEGRADNRLRRHDAMPEVQLIAEGALARADLAPTPDLACESLTRGIVEIMEACLRRNHLQGSDLGIAYQVCKTALQRILQERVDE